MIWLSGIDTEVVKSWDFPSTPNPECPPLLPLSYPHLLLKLMLFSLNFKKINQLASYSSIRQFCNLLVRPMPIKICKMGSTITYPGLYTEILPRGGANLGYGKKRGAEALCVRSTPSRGIRGHAPPGTGNILCFLVLLASI